MDRENRKVNEKIEKLRNWLRGNVVSPSTPKVITLSDFEFDFKDFNGTFKVTLDNLRFISGFRFSIDISGKSEISPPMFISPMGVPASYPSIELTEETTNEITKLINDFFPKVKPLGIDKETSVFIDRNVPMSDRVVDPKELNWVVDEVSSEGFELRGTL